MKKTIIYGFIIALLLFSATPVQAASQDVPEVEWQKFLGGSNFEQASNIQQTADGGYIVAGETSTTDGEFSGNHGGADAWVVKLSTSGSVEWQNCLGGSGYEDANSIQQTKDGGYIVAGYTESNDGDVSGYHGNADMWIVALDEDGEIERQKCLGGSATEFAYSVQPTADKGYIVAGFTGSSDGDVEKMMDMLKDLSDSTVESLDAIKYEDFKQLVKDRGSFRIAFEDIMFSTKVAIESKEDFFDFVLSLIENDFNTTAYSYLDGFNEYFSYDTKIEELYKKLEEKKLAHNHK